MDRRDFLKQGFLAALTLGGASLSQGRSPLREELQSVRSVIFFIYDGFDWENFTLARHFSLQERGRPLLLERLFQEGALGGLFTSSRNSLVTDSAAASTAFGCGQKTDNRYLGMLPDGRKLRTILELARAQGRAIGLITTTRITHATPAGFAAHVPDRDMEDEIAAQYLSLAPEVLLGGGSRHFDPERREDRRDLYAEYRRAGYSMLRTAEELERANGSRLLGTFAPSHLPYEVDRRFQGEPGPSLREMVQKGLAVLDGYDRGFVVQIEAGRIDHANHANDPGAMLWEVLAADEALEVVFDYVQRRPETLLLFASDHGTGGGVLYGLGGGYAHTNAGFAHLSNRRASYDWLLERWAEDRSEARIREEAREKLGVELSPEDLSRVLALLDGRVEVPDPVAYHTGTNALAWAVADGGSFERPEQLNVAYATGQHTAGIVPVAVLGGGVAPGPLGLVENTALFFWAARALGVPVTLDG
ncbi:MAG: alkaline phosphatase [Candidatus Poribacteria bacterium]|nr:MAG: alkaline phosphatase [Candidatus Poribacteria bacterium]